jgi:hypothetical protein
MTGISRAMTVRRSALNLSDSFQVGLKEAFSRRVDVAYISPFATSTRVFTELME